MPFTPISLGVRSNVGRDQAAGCARFINCFADDAGDDAKAKYPVYACEGWTSFATMADGGVTRGMFNLDDVRLWALSGSVLYYIGTDGEETIAGVGGTTGSAYFARNRATTPDVMMVTSDGLIRRMSGVIVSVPSYAAGIGASLFNSVCGMAGYFIFTKSDGEFYVSGIDTTTIDELDFATAQNNADGLLRGVVVGDSLILAGPRSMEYWRLVGNADFPFERQFAANFGTYAAPAMVPLVAVIGGQTRDTMIWPATGPQGEYIGVMMLEGFGCQKISNWQLDAAIKAEPTRTSIRAYSYTAQGVTFYCITASSFTWEFNCKTGFWHERRGFGLQIAQTVDACEFNGQTILGDRSAGLLYRMSSSLTPASASEVSVRTSRDNGANFATARTKTVGGGSERSKRTKFNRFGQSQEDGFQFEITITNAIVEGSNAVSMTVTPPLVHATPFPITVHALYVDAVPGVSQTANAKGIIQIGIDTDQAVAA